MDNLKYQSRVTGVVVVFTKPILWSLFPDGTNKTISAVAERKRKRDSADTINNVNMNQGALQL
jgi:hypothetical protein